MENIKNNIEEIGISLTAQTDNLAPADKKIYALRDSIGSTDSLALIASSIMSKKLASGANNIVLDVTCGSGAFMKNKKDAEALYNTMKSLATDDIKIDAVMTRMDEPLGYSVGNLLEVRESLEVLKGRQIEDVLDVTYALGSKIMSNDFTREEATKKMKEVLQNGSAYNKFIEMVEAHGGETEYLIKEKFNEAKHIIPYNIENIKEDLWVKEVDAMEIAKSAFALGTGRMQKDDEIDYLSGIVLNVKVGDKVNDKLLATIHSNDLEKVEEAKKHLSKAFVFTNRKIKKPNPIIKY